MDKIIRDCKYLTSNILEYIINNDKIYLLEFIELNANSMILIQCHIFSQYKIVNCVKTNYEDYRLSIMSE